MIKLNGVEVKPTVFPDKTSQVWKLANFDFSKVRQARITWDFENEVELIHLIQLEHLLRVNEVTTALDINYLPYGRQDKEVSNESTFALRTFAKVLNSFHFNEVNILDPHSKVALDLINRSYPVYPTGQLASAVKETKSTLLCYPDKGAVTKYTELKHTPYTLMPYVYGEKVRDQSSGNITHYSLVGNVQGENVMIVDDICDGGMTFKLLARDLRAGGAKNVSLFVTHGLFSKGTGVLFEAGISRIFTKNGEVSHG